MELAMKRNCRTRIAQVAVLLFAGFVGGSVLAETAAISFKKVTLFQAMQRIHKGTGKDVVWKDDTATAESFELSADAPEVLIAGVAKKFGRDAVRVSSVYVLDPALPDLESPMARVSALDDYLSRTLPTSNQGDFYSPFSIASLKRTKGLHAGLTGGVSTFNQLTPVQQEGLLNALRVSQIDALLGALVGGVIR